jgi:hypothetical protein
MFSTVLADAPRLLAFLLPRDMVALCHSDTGAVRNAVLCHRPAIALLLGERVLAFDTRKISLREAVLSSLLLLQDVPRDVPSAEAKATAKACDARPALHLDQLHRLLPPEPAGWKRRGTIGQERWQRAVVAERWKQRGAQRSPEMMKCYRAFVRDVVGPLVKAAGETELFFSRIPLIRTHFPLPIPDAQDQKMLETCHQGKKSKRRGIRQPGVSTQRHTDGRFGHPSSEFNIWLPLSNAWGSNSLYRDATPWSGPSSSLPFDLEYGQFVIFYGNQVPHETRPNTTGLTRCSLDLRCIPGSLFQKDFRPKTYSAEGVYYDRLQL